ncbi:hypothetical protein F0562_000095 [Nyssa sinensis]|uniref:Uncharacterized protein n=1 Tax=Nyssa sinensis TaxID=561372 RepID=A0A5J5C481_9ASTE|nr:hypothetical protein F0562_000095 [Nyssa sinensis]
MSFEDEYGGISFAAEAEEFNEQLHQSFKGGNDMLKLAIEGQWNNVLRIHERNSSARENSLHSDDTVLHIAVSDGREDTVQKLLNISERDGFSVMHKKNNKGNTPIHLAAAMGNVAICKCLAPKVPELIADRNNAGETPLFLAAHHGKREAFLFLHELHTRRRGGVPDYSSCEKSDETSILHSAIYGKVKIGRYHGGVCGVSLIDQ